MSVAGRDVSKHLILTYSEMIQAILLDCVIYQFWVESTRTSVRFAEKSRGYLEEISGTCNTQTTL